MLYQMTHEKECLLFQSCFLLSVDFMFWTCSHMLSLRALSASFVQINLI